MKFEWKYSPKHEKLSASQAKKELKEISVSLDELPLIRRSDPAVRKLLDDGVDENRRCNQDNKKFKDGWECSLLP